MVSPRIKTFCVEREANSVQREANSVELCAVRAPFCCLNILNFVDLYSNCFVLFFANFIFFGDSR